MSLNLFGEVSKAQECLHCVVWAKELLFPQLFGRAVGLELCQGGC